MDTSTRRHGFYLQIIIILLGLGVLRLWMLPVEILPRAAAQGLPDSGAQRQQQIELARQTNDILVRMENHLREGKLNVRVVETVEGNKPAKSGNPSRGRS